MADFGVPYYTTLPWFWILGKIALQTCFENPSVLLNQRKWKVILGENMIRNQVVAISASFKNGLKDPYIHISTNWDYLAFFMCFPFTSPAKDVQGSFVLQEISGYNVIIYKETTD